MFELLFFKTQFIEYDNQYQNFVVQIDKGNMFFKIENILENI